MQSKQINPTHVAAVRKTFALSAEQANQALQAAQAIVQNQAWIWDAQELTWWGNEVELHHQGQTLRLDRLVQRKRDGAWWVLDYKLSSQPEKQAELQEQMAVYRAAVQAVYPGDVVNAALIGGSGVLCLIASNQNRVLTPLQKGGIGGICVDPS